MTENHFHKICEFRSQHNGIGMHPADFGFGLNLVMYKHFVCIFLFLVYKSLDPKNFQYMCYLTLLIPVCIRFYWSNGTTLRFWRHFLKIK